jgi:hypothetical protein
MSNLIRQSHRWISIAFTVAVIITFVAMSREGSPEWVAYLPLPPLFLLLFSGLYLFALPYLARRRGGSARQGAD